MYNSLEILRKTAQAQKHQRWVMRSYRVNAIVAAHIVERIYVLVDAGETTPAIERTIEREFKLRQKTRSKPQ